METPQVTFTLNGISVVAPTYWLHMHTPKRWAAAMVLT